MGLWAIGRALQRRAAVTNSHRHEIKIPFERVWKPIDGIVRHRNYNHPSRSLPKPRIGIRQRLLEGVIIVSVIGRASAWLAT
jgi:hypothetical protein